MSGGLLTPRLWSSAKLTAVWGGSSVYILVWQILVLPKAQRGGTGWHFGTTVDRIIIRRISYLFVSYLWSHVTGCMARAEGRHSAHRWLTPFLLWVQRG